MLQSALVTRFTQQGTQQGISRAQNYSSKTEMLPKLELPKFNAKLILVKVVGKYHQRATTKYTGKTSPYLKIPTVASNFYKNP